MRTQYIKEQVLNGVENIAAKGAISFCRDFFFQNSSAAEASESMCMWDWVMY